MKFKIKQQFFLKTLFSNTAMLLLATLFCSSQLLAQESQTSSEMSAAHKTQFTEVITVTGTHIADTNNQRSLAKVVINADEIAALAPNSFADVLRGLPGIDIIEQGGLTFLSIRGGDPNFVTILIDGVKVNDPTNSRGGAFDLGTLDPSLIAQVEMFYGSYSTVFGSDALSGVISIQTKGVEEGKLGIVSLKAGSNNSLGGSFHLATVLADLAQLSISGSVQDGDDSYFGDSFKRQEIIASIKSTNLNNTKWELGFFYADGESAAFPEDSGGDRLSDIRMPESRDYQQTNFNANLQHQFSNSLRLDIKSALSEREEDISSPGIAPAVLDGVPAIDSISSYQRLDISMTANYMYTNNLTMALGVALAEEDGGMESIIDFGFPVPADYTLARFTESVFAEVGYNPAENLNFTMALRHDETDGGQETEAIKVDTFRIISRYQFNSITDISMQYSEGFKLPSFFAVGHPFVGNPLLKPELSENYDVSLNHHLLNNKLTTTASIYKNTFTDLVDFDPINFINVNRSKVEARGVELSFTYHPTEKLNISGHVTYNKMDTFESDIKLRRRPEFKAGILLSHQASDVLFLSSRITFNDNYYDSSIPTGLVEIDSYYRVDFSAKWSIKKDITLRFNANNLLDDSYEEAVGFSNMGQSFTVSISKDF
ncbi:MAG: TonB-dependent receptor [Colwellia sp.]|nr:TonB-dependent receptor [Colwellia sp.]